MPRRTSNRSSTAGVPDRPAIGRRTFPALGTTIAVLAPADDVETALNPTRELFERWEQTLSRLRPESEQQGKFSVSSGRLSYSEGGDTFAGDLGSIDGSGRIESTLADGSGRRLNLVSRLETSPAARCRAR